MIGSGVFFVCVLLLGGSLSEFCVFFVGLLEDGFWKREFLAKFQEKQMVEWWLIPGMEPKRGIFMLRDSLVMTGASMVLAHNQVAQVVFEPRKICMQFQIGVSRWHIEVVMGPWGRGHFQYTNQIPRRSHTSRWVARMLSLWWWDGSTISTWRIFEIPPNKEGFLIATFWETRFNRSFRFLQKVIGSM